jgi:hypothetical protein
MAKEKNISTNTGLTVKTDLSAVTAQIKKSMSDVSKEIKDSSEKTIAAISTIPQEQSSTFPEKKLDAINVGVKAIRVGLQNTNRSLNYIAVKMNDQLSIMKAEANSAFDRRDDFGKKTEKEPTQQTTKPEEKDEKAKQKGLFSFIGDWIKNLFGKSIIARFIAGLATFWGMVKISAAAFANTKLGGILTGVFRTLGGGLLRLFPWVALATSLFSGIGNALNSDEVARVTGKKKEDIGISDRIDVGVASALSTLSLGLFESKDIYDASKKVDTAVIKMFSNVGDWFGSLSFDNFGDNIRSAVKNMFNGVGETLLEWSKKSTAVKGFIEAGSKFAAWWNKGVEADKNIAEKARKRNKALFDKAINSIINPKDQEMLKTKWNTLTDYLGQMWDSFAEKAKGWLQKQGLWKPNNGYDQYDPSSVKSVQRTLNETPEEIINKGVQATDFFVKQGWTPKQAAAIAGNLSVESEFNPKAIGDDGKAYGIAQWHKDRQDKFKELYGKNIRDSSMQEQLKFVDWELRNSESKAGDLLKSTHDVTQAARTVDKTYERSSGEHINRRVEQANAIYSKRKSIIDEKETEEFNKAVVKTKPQKQPTFTDGFLADKLKQQPVIQQKPKTEAPKEKVKDKEEKILKVSEKVKEPVKKESDKTTVAMSNNTSNNSKSDVYFIQQAPLQQYSGAQINTVG